MSDLAREMNVARTTLYRLVESVDEALALASGRAVYRFLDEWSDAMLGGESWWDSCVQAVVRAVSMCTENPVLRRLLDHEPDVLGELMTHGGLEILVHRLGEIAEPMVDAAIASGYVAPVDTSLACEHAARSMVAMIICPPAGDLRAAVEFMLAPLAADQFRGRQRA